VPNVVVFPFVTTKKDARVVEMQGVRDRMHQISAELDKVCAALSGHVVARQKSENNPGRRADWVESEPYECGKPGNSGKAGS
jgi:hypothetical protein